LLELRQHIGASRLVAAFHTQLPHPLWEEQHNVALGAHYLTGRIVEPGETFSLLRVIGPFTRERGYREGPTYVGAKVIPTVGGGVCKIATTLYNAVIYADLTVVERHPHSMPVPYVPPGRDAAIATGHKDFRFRNDTDAPLLLWAGMRGTALYIAFYGRHVAPRVEWGHEELGRQKTWTVRQASGTLPKGAERVVMEGHDGVTVRSWVTVTYPGQPPLRRELGVDTYRPLPRVVEYGA